MAILLQVALVTLILLISTFREDLGSLLLLSFYFILLLAKSSEKIHEYMKDWRFTI